MATFRAGEEQHYGGQGGTGFFSIAEDKQVKQVRFMYNGIEDVEGMSVHKVKVPGTEKPRYVNCLRAYNEPVDECPLCKAGYDTQARLFIPIYNIDEDKVQLWDRGKTMFAKMSGLCSRYAANGQKLVSNIFEVERHGKPKDQKTTYEIYHVEEDGTQLDDLPEPKKVLGGLVLDKTPEEMEYYLSHGDFPEVPDDNNNSTNEMPVRRRGAERRTPANRGEAF